MKIKQTIRAWAMRALAAIGYEGATSGRRGYTVATGSADVISEWNLTRLRDRSRHLVRNHWAAKRAVDVITAHVVGPGIMPSCRTNPRLDALLDSWANHRAQVGSQKGQSLGAVQRLVCRTVIESGSCIVVRQHRTTRQMVARDLVLPFQLQVLEPEYLDTMRDNATTYGGVEYDATGWPLAYWIYDRHPSLMGATSERVPADDVAQMFWQQRPGQTLGIPWMHAVLVKLKDFDDYEDAQLLRQKIAAIFAGFVKNMSGSPSRNTTTEAISLEPGRLQFLEPGEEVEFSSPPAVSGYDEYTHVTLRSIAAGIGMAYEDLTGDYSRVNFSSARMGALVSHELVDQWRHEMMIGQLCMALDRWAHDGAEMMGVIDGEHPACEWTPPGRKLIDPSREVGAIERMIKAGLTSRQAEVRRLGRDVEEVDAERLDDAEREITLGLVPEPEPEDSESLAMTHLFEDLRLQ